MGMTVIELSGNGTCTKFSLLEMQRWRWVWDSIFGWLCNTILNCLVTSSDSRTWSIYLRRSLERPLECLWGSPNPCQGPTPASGHPRVHFASQQIPRTEATREVPVALIAQEIFQVYLIFEHRQSLPGKSTLHLQLLPFCSCSAGCKYLQGAPIQESLCLRAVLNPSPELVQVKALRHYLTFPYISQQLELFFPLQELTVKLEV